LIDPDTGDTLTCYDNKTLRKIATKVTYANECDSLYNLQELEIANLDSTLVLQAIMLSKKNEIIGNKDIQIQKRDDHIVDLKAIIKKKERKIRWLKVGWATTGVVAGGAIIYLLVK
jgi:hypothetical protein